MTIGGFALPAAAAPPAASSDETSDYAYLSGTVSFGQSGEPGAGVTVQLQGADGGLYSFVASRVDGSYTVSTPSPGDYRIIFIPPLEGPSYPGARYQTQYLGGAADPAQARIVRVEAGVDQTGLDITLPLSSGEPTTVSRIGGADRYAVAVDVSRSHWPDGDADTVWIVTGENYPDALSAGPAAIIGDDPILLTQPHHLPDDVRAEIARLEPSRIVVVGGPASVSEDVFAQLAAIVPDTTRISGSDRYEVSRNVARFAFSDRGPSLSAFVATGANYPDALTAGAVAGSRDAPVILVDGSAGSLDDATRDLLADLPPFRVTIAGGADSVSEGIENALASIAPTDRVSGEDRYDVAVQLISDYQIGVPRYAFLVTGSKFPDALSAAASAGAFVQPLYLAQPDCVPVSVLQSMRERGVEWVILVGGEQSLSAPVASLTPCLPAS